MTKAEIIKFRITTRQKVALMSTAERHGLPVSRLLRNAAQRIVSGRPVDGSVRAEMLKVRQAVNELNVLLTRGNLTPESLARALCLIETIRTIAARELSPQQ
jgi:antitoxin component of RelBE/YafQ-DinJ toxin-antitoxin module